MRLTILGGGIAGLSAAYYALNTARYQTITVFEASHRWGGKILTERIPHNNGQFVIEGGPDTFLATKPWGVALCQELGLSSRLHGTHPHYKNTYVLHKGHLQPLPDGLALMIPTSLVSILKSPLISWPGKLRMGQDLLLPAHNGQHDESLGGFISRRLGREAYDAFIEPLLSGIYAGDGDLLSLQSTFPYLRDLEVKYGSLTRGALEMHKKMPASPGSRSAFLTPTTGLAEIVEKLVEHLRANGVNLHLNTLVLRIGQHAARYEVELDSGDALETDALILATPAAVSASLLASFDPELASVLGSIPYASTATVSLAYHRSDLPRPLDGYGYVIPRREGRRALACTWTSTKFPHRAPQDYALLRVFVGRAGQTLTPPFTTSEGARETSHPSRMEGLLRPIQKYQPQVSLPPGEEAKEHLLSLAREELALTLGITAEPLLSRVFIWENAMPQYNLGHPEKLAQIEAALTRYPGLALTGNGYRGIGIPDCIHSGKLAVQSATAGIERTVL